MRDSAGGSEVNGFDLIGPAYRHLQAQESVGGAFWPDGAREGRALNGEGEGCKAQPAANVAF